MGFYGAVWGFSIGRAAARVMTGVGDHEVTYNVVFIHEPRLRASNKLELWFNTYR
jgi:hypothetical protein